MIIKKLGLFVLWCICIILGLKALTHAFSETVGIVIIVCVVVVADIVQRYLNRHERWFRKRVNMLRTICPNSPNDFRMIGDPLFESFSLGNFFIQYKPETKEFHLCCCIYMVLPNIVETWNKAIEDINTIIAQRAPYVKIVIDRHGELGQGFSLIIPAKKAKKTLLLAFAHILLELKKSLPYRTNENGILVCEVYFKIKVFNTICYGEYDGVRVLKAVTISSDGNYTFVNVEEDECVPEDFTKSNPPMSIILQYDLYSIETNMLLMRIGRNARIYANRNHFVHKFQTISLKVLYYTDIHQLKDDNKTIKIMEEKIKLRDILVDVALQWQASFGIAPSITSSISEYDAAMLVGMSEKEHSDYMRDKTAVAKGTDFVYRNIRYQVKANRPSGKKGSKVTMVPKASNYEWDRLIWILYNKDYVMQEAWEWYMKDYKMAFENKKRLSPEDYRKGHCLYHI